MSFSNAIEVTCMMFKDLKIQREHAIKWKFYQKQIKPNLSFGILAKVPLPTVGDQNTCLSCDCFLFAIWDEYLHA